MRMRGRQRQLGARDKEEEGGRRGGRRLPELTLKTCLQFFPLSFSLLSSISITSTKSLLYHSSERNQLYEGWRRTKGEDELVVSELSDLVHLSA